MDIRVNEQQITQHNTTLFILFFASVNEPQQFIPHQEYVLNYFFLLTEHHQQLLLMLETENVIN